MTESEQTALQGLWLYRWLARFKFLSYRAKIMLMAFVGTHIPLISLATYFALQSSPNWQTFFTTVGVTLLATLIGTGITLFVLNQLLRPVMMTSRALRVWRESRRRLPLPAEFDDEAGTLMADTGRAMDHLDQMLETLEYRDESTGLPNRKRFLQVLASRLAADAPLAVVVLRFANYPRLVETLDLQQAEKAARALALALGARADLGTHLARIDAMHFACTMGVRQDDRTPWVDVAGRVALAIDACAADIPLDGIAISPVVRGGVASFPVDGCDADALLDQAIAAAAQAVDGAPVRLHSAQARQAVLHRFQIEQELRRALDRDEFDLYYQPVVDIHAGRTVGAEALIRWRHPERGVVAPGEFIAAAEASGLIEPIGLWVLRRACAQVREWNDSGHQRLRTAINLSARQFLDPQLAQHVLRAVEAHGISPYQLEIELTETAAMVDHDHTRRMFGSLREMGVGIAIDDFGTGFASMSYLRKLPFDKLKIDREFVSDVHRLPQSQAICSALIELSKGLGLTVLAEGTENEAEVRFLAGRGCALFQGYFFSRPVPSDEFARVLDTPPAALRVLRTAVDETPPATRADAVTSGA